MSVFSAFSPSELTTGVLVGIAVLLLFTGQLIPRWVVTQIRKDAEARVTAANQEASDWKAAYMTSNAAREVQGRRLDDLLDATKTTDAFIRALPAASRRLRDS